jgi:Protein of unknown function with PCYCGC motif
MSKPSRKSSPPPAPPIKARKRTPLALVGVALAALAIGVVVFVQRDSVQPEAPAQAAAAPAVPPEALASAGPAPAVAVPAPGPDPQSAVVLGPHPQKDFPPLQLPAYPLSRSPEMITAAYRFAAEHPEILTYVPCFCGCERGGHRGNEDCFVQKRGANGDVTEWTEHGMECAVCLDVAQQAMQMHASGASVRDIRAAVEQKWASQAAQSHSHTPTPEPPR